MVTRFTGTTTSSSDLLPALILIHGDSYSWGSGNPLDGTALAAHGRLIVVSINFRLGIFGKYDLISSRMQKCHGEHRSDWMMGKSFGFLSPRGRVFQYSFDRVVEIKNPPRLRIIRNFFNFKSFGLSVFERFDGWCVIDGGDRSYESSGVGKKMWLRALLDL